MKTMKLNWKNQRLLACCVQLLCSCMIVIMHARIILNFVYMNAGIVYAWMLVVHDCIHAYVMYIIHKNSIFAYMRFIQKYFTKWNWIVYIFKGCLYIACSYVLKVVLAWSYSCICNAYNSCVVIIVCIVVKDSPHVATVVYTPSSRHFFLNRKFHCTGSVTATPGEWTTDRHFLQLNYAKQKMSVCSSLFWGLYYWPS